jgi:hypothetical protein
MKPLSTFLDRQLAVFLMLWLAMPAGGAGTAIAQQASPNQQQQSAALQQGSQATNPPTNQTGTQNPLPDNPAPVSSPALEGTRENGAPQSGSSQPPNGAQKPVGTAAAPYERTTGVAASRPAGAAIAPAKQRRVRTILISLGVVVGAGIAVGSVAALSHGSPSRP